jgi:hypothetical protein
VHCRSSAQREDLKVELIGIGKRSGDGGDPWGVLERHRLAVAAEAVVTHGRDVESMRGEIREGETGNEVGRRSMGWEEAKRTDTSRVWAERKKGDDDWVSSPKGLCRPLWLAKGSPIAVNMESPLLSTLVDRVNSQSESKRSTPHSLRLGDVSGLRPW